MNPPVSIMFPRPTDAAARYVFGV